MTTTTKLSKAQIKTLLTIVAAGSEMNGYAGQRGFHPHSADALVRSGMLQRVAPCEPCATAEYGQTVACARPLTGQRGAQLCYLRVRITDAGRDAVRHAAPEEYAAALPAERLRETVWCDAHGGLTNPHFERGDCLHPHFTDQETRARMNVAAGEAHA